MIRAVLSVAALLSPFFFPYVVTLVLAVSAALFLPAVALFTGILVDLLYYTPGASPLPFATIAGVCIAGLAIVVRRFLKARILSR
jgi:hypothetical protein